MGRGALPALRDIAPSYAGTRLNAGSDHALEPSPAVPALGEEGFEGAHTLGRPRRSLHQDLTGKRSRSPTQKPLTLKPGKPPLGIVLAPSTDSSRATGRPRGFSCQGTVCSPSPEISTAAIPRGTFLSYVRCRFAVFRRRGGGAGGRRAAGENRLGAVGGRLTGSGHRTAGGWNRSAGVWRRPAGAGQGLAGVRRPLTGTGERLADVRQPLASPGERLAAAGESPSETGGALAGAGQSTAGTGQWTSGRLLWTLEAGRS
jgi:hypothetical protein